MGSGIKAPGNVRGWKGVCVVVSLCRACVLDSGELGYREEMVQAELTDRMCENAGRQRCAIDRSLCFVLVLRPEPPASDLWARVLHPPTPIPLSWSTPLPRGHAPLSFP